MPGSLYGELPERVKEEWIALPTNGEGDTSLLERRTAFLLERGTAHDWRDGLLWEWTSNVLDSWENSTRIKKAGRAYVSLLFAIGDSTSPEAPPFSYEEAYRERLQRALSVVGKGPKRGRLHRFLAESWWRDLSRGDEVRRTVEAYYQRALRYLEEGAERAEAKLAFARLYAQWPEEAEGDGARHRTYPYRTQALALLREVEQNGEVDASVRKEAARLLGDLLASGLEVEIAERFLPFTEIRLPVWSRNLATAEVRMELLDPQDVEVRTRDQLLEIPEGPVAGEAEQPAEATTVLEREIPLAGAESLNWKRTQLALGDAYEAGWYRLTLRTGDHLIRKLVLVSPVELILARGGENLEGWLLNSLSGRPPASAKLVVHHGKETTLVPLDPAAKGRFRLAAPLAEKWTEILAYTENGPAWLRAERQQQELPPAHLLLAARDRLLPGETLRWLRAGPEAPAGELLLPSGNRLKVVSEELVSGFREERVELPENVAAEGPLYWADGEGTRVLLAHLHRQRTLPFKLTVDGERLREKTRLFYADRPLRLQLEGTNKAESRDGERAAYLRFEITPVVRTFNLHSRRKSGQTEKPVMERIVSYDKAVQDGLTLRLDTEEESSPTRIYRVRAFSLREDKLLAQTHVGLSGVRRFLVLRQQEKLLRQSESARIEMEWRQVGETGDAPPVGELDVIRETFVTRYIHNRRGTVIDAEAYEELPDRSLLGSAKTDYRFHKREYVRKVVARLRPPERGTSRVEELPLETSGFYTVRYRNRGPETRAVFPEGPLEFWVLPENPTAAENLRALQSERPRLLVEPGEEGKLEILFLGKPEAGGLYLHLRKPEGGSYVHAFNVKGPGVFREWKPDAGSASGLQRGRVLYEAIWSGGGASLYLSGSYGERVAEPLRLEGRRFGLSPGSSYRFALESRGNETPSTLAWKLFPEGKGRLQERKADLQREFNRRRQSERFDGITFSGEWLPIADPAGEAMTLPQSSGSSQEPIPDWRLLELLYPELRISPGESSSGGDGGFFAQPCDQQARNCRLNGPLPALPGRWELVALEKDFLAEDSLHVWPLSTEQALSATLEGPESLRKGDEAPVVLRLVNASGSERNITLRWLGRGGNLSGEKDSVPVKIPAGESRRFSRRFLAEDSSHAEVRVRLRDGSERREFRQPIAILATSAKPAFTSAWAVGGTDPTELRMQSDGWIGTRLVAGSGLYPLFAYAWPGSREDLEPVAPLLAFLGDWALLQAYRRQGLSSDAGEIERKGRKLAELLAEHQDGEGGLRMHPSLPPDEWLSGLGLWTLRRFGTPPELPEAVLDRLDDYAREQLLRGDVTNGEMLLFLRGTVDSREMGRPARPTRLQARRFLDLFRMRDRLHAGELGQLLLLAREFQFREEIELLDEALRQKTPGEEDAFSSALAYFSLAGGTEAPGKAAHRHLGNFLQHLSAGTGRAGWREAGGWLHLMAGFRRDGDFSIGGHLDLQGNEHSLGRVDLEARKPEDAFLSVAPALFGKGGEETRWLLSASAEVPFRYLFVSGRKDKGPAEQSGTAEKLFRVYEEPTLLAGSHVQEDPYSGAKPLGIGERLRQVLEVRLEEPHAYLLLDLPIPAGFSLAPEDVRLAATSSEEAMPLKGEAEVLLRPSAGTAFFLLHSVPAGTHRFLVDMKSEWPGNYSWPIKRLRFPREGAGRNLTGPRRLKVSDKAVGEE